MDNLIRLEQKMGVVFNDKLLLRTALTHSSYAKQKANRFLVQDNERLEYLGDAVLKLVSSRYLYIKYPQFLEGQLTKVRAKLVSDLNLCKLAQLIDLGDYILFSYGEKNTGGDKKVSNLANAFEALLGACYLDQGLEVVDRFFEELMNDHFDDLMKEELLVDHKTQLQEFFQRKKQALPLYTVAKIDGPDHEKTFYVHVEVVDNNQNLRFSGNGRSKKEAEQASAREALDYFKKKKGI
jgi:ribonuclease-3